MARLRTMDNIVNWIGTHNNGESIGVTADKTLQGVNVEKLHEEDKCDQIDE